MDGGRSAAPGRDGESWGETPGSNGRSSYTPCWMEQLCGTRVGCRKLVGSGLGRREHDGLHAADHDTDLGVRGGYRYIE